VNWFRQLLSFIGIGGFCTVLQYLILFLLTELLAIHPTIASTTGYALSAIVNYLLNRRFTFECDTLHTKALPRFITVVVIGLILNWIVLDFFYSIINLHYLSSQIIASIVVLFWNFGANKIWTFSEKTK
jgi:putative flippase GtrA